MTHSALRDEDGSINFVWDLGDGQALEARYVTRDEGELICYLSSQTACRRACRMCHLTRTGQVHPVNTTFDEFIMQASTVLNELDARNTFRTVSFNFMARGEPLDNPVVYTSLLERLGDLALSDHGLLPRFKISTIMPEGANLNLVQRFPLVFPDIYYSLYSVCPEFRKKWFPKAVSPEAGLARLKQWQDHTHKIPKIHLALIKGRNDSVTSLTRLCNTIVESRLRADFNIVRYNPYDGLSEEGNWEFAAQMLQHAFPDSNVQTIQRVGFSVKASCGMFVS